MRDAFDVVIVGAGQAGVQAADSLRKSGFGGSITLISAEDHLPYERPPLSKAFLKADAEVADFLLRGEEYYQAQRIDLRLSETVESIAPAAHEITVDDGRKIGYGRLIWAAGGRARSLSLPGSDLDGVLSLRTRDDAERLRSRLATARSAVIIGGGYIGLEAAAVFASRGIEVTLVEAQERLLARVTCDIVSQFYADLHRAAGSTIRLSSGVRRILDENGRAAGVELADGEIVNADFVIVGVGLIPNVEALAAAGATIANGVEVDEKFQTSLTDVYAIGDCASVRSPYASDQRVRLESVPNAIEHGKAVARVLTGGETAPTAAPWFWSHQFDVKLQTVGLQAGHEEAVLRGDIGAGSFSVVYLRDGRVIALDCVNAVGDFAQGKHLVAHGAQATAAELTDTDRPLKSLLASV